MFKLIENLRAKPERTKKRFAFLVSFLVAGIIFVVWLTIIYPDFMQNQNEVAHVVKPDPSPLSTLGATISNGFGAIGDEYNKMKEAFSASSTELSATSTVETDTSDSSLYDPIRTTTVRQ